MGGLKITTVPWQPKLCATLKGCNSLTGETMASPFLQCPELTTTQTTIPSSELTMRFERFKTVSEVCKSLDVSASMIIPLDTRPGSTPEAGDLPVVAR